MSGQRDNLGEPSPEQHAALAAFAETHGRTWKAALREAWMSGNYPQMADENHAALLQQVRNTFGPRWLMLWTLNARRVGGVR